VADDPLTCQYCGQLIREAIPGERTPSSAWAADEPCRTDAPGHVPTDPEPMHLWRVWPDGRELHLDTISGFAVRATRRRMPSWDASTSDGSRFELRPIPRG
jgi:hypothetical protein